MESAAGILIDPHDVIEGANPKGQRPIRGGEINRRVHAPAEQEAVQTPNGKKRAVLGAEVLAHDVAGAV